MQHSCKFYRTDKSAVHTGCVMINGVQLFVYAGRCTSFSALSTALLM